jgi:hypothetical protein
MSRPAYSTPKAISPRPFARMIDHRRPAEVEILAIPDIGLDNPPVADELAVLLRSHAGAAMSFGSHLRLQAATAKVKAHPTRSRSRYLVFSCPATVLTQPKASLIRLRIGWLTE